MNDQLLAAVSQYGTPALFGIVAIAAIGVEPRVPHDRRSVRHIARELNRPVPELIAQLQRAIDAAAQPPGGAPR